MAAVLSGNGPVWMRLTFFLDPRRGLTQCRFAHVVEQGFRNGAFHLYVTGVKHATAVGGMLRVRLHVPMPGHIVQVGRLVVIQTPSQTAAGRVERVIVIGFKLKQKNEWMDRAMDRWTQNNCSVSKGKHVSRP